MNFLPLEICELKAWFHCLNRHLGCWGMPGVLPLPAESTGLLGGSCRFHHQFFHPVCHIVLMSLLASSVGNGIKCHKCWLRQRNGWWDFKGWCENHNRWHFEMNSLQITSFFKTMNVRRWDGDRSSSWYNFEVFQHINRSGHEPLCKILNHILDLITCWFIYSSFQDSGVDCFLFDIQDTKHGCFRAFAIKATFQPCNGAVFFH